MTLDSVTTDAAGSTSIAANITTVAGQTYNDAVSITGTTVVLASTTMGDITFAGTVDASTAGTSALTVNTGGGTFFGGTPIFFIRLRDPSRSRL